MPKMKTKKSAAKRFKVLGSGRIKRSHAMHRHLLTKKRPDRKRRLRAAAEVHAHDRALVRRMLPYG